MINQRHIAAIIVPSAKTAGIAAALLAFKILVLQAVMDRLISTGTRVLFGGFRNMASDSENLLREITVGCVLGPVGEGLMYCGLPIYVADRIMGPEHEQSTRSMYWPLGLVSAGLFAYSHGWGEYQNDYYLPLPQLTSGLVYWHVARRYGLPQSLLCHALHNTFNLALYYAQTT